MITVAGGILLALFVLAVLFGFALIVRDGFRFTSRIVRGNGLLIVGVCVLVGVVLYTYAWNERSIAATEACTGQCEYR